MVNPLPGFVDQWYKMLYHCGNDVKTPLIQALLEVDVMMEIPDLVQSLKSSRLSSTSSQLGDTFWGVRRAALEQLICKGHLFFLQHL